MKGRAALHAGWKGVHLPTAVSSDTVQTVLQSVRSYLTSGTSRGTHRAPDDRAGVIPVARRTCGTVLTRLRPLETPDNGSSSRRLIQR